MLSNLDETFSKFRFKCFLKMQKLSKFYLPSFLSYINKVFLYRIQLSNQLTDCQRIEKLFNTKYMVILTIMGSRGVCS